MAGLLGTHPVKPEKATRAVLDSWQFWMGVAYFGLVLVVVALYFQNGRIDNAQRRADRAETLHLASVTAEASSAYTQCVLSIPTLQKVDTFVRGVQELHQTLLTNARLAHQATPPGTAAYRVQASNLIRLRHSADAVKGLTFHVPTVKECRHRRDAILAQIVLK